MTKASANCGNSQYNMFLRNIELLKNSVEDDAKYQFNLVIMPNGETFVTETILEKVMSHQDYVTFYAKVVEGIASENPLTLGGNPLYVHPDFLSRPPTSEGKVLPTLPQSCGMPMDVTLEGYVNHFRPMFVSEQSAYQDLVKKTCVDAYVSVTMSDGETEDFSSPFLHSGEFSSAAVVEKTARVEDALVNLCDLYADLAELEAQVQQKAEETAEALSNPTVVDNTAVYGGTAAINTLKLSEDIKNTYVSICKGMRQLFIACGMHKVHEMADVEETPISEAMFTKDLLSGVDSDRARMTKLFQANIRNFYAKVFCTCSA